MKLSMKICLVLAAIASLPYATCAPRRGMKYSKSKSKSKSNKYDKKSSKKSKNGKKSKYGLDKQTELVVFGDSLSDVGNVNQFAPCALDPIIPDVYCGDRASNGPLVVDLVATALGFPLLIPSVKIEPITGYPIPSGGTNYAVGSATTFQNDFSTQVKLYLWFLQISQETPTPSIDATTLFYIEFGGNDVLDALSTNDLDAAVAFIGKAVKDYITNVEALVELGACSILVGGPADVGKAPIAFDFRIAASGLSFLFNKLLKSAVEGVTIANNDDLCYGIKFFDFFAITNEVLDDKRFQKEFPDPEAKCNDRFVVDCDQCNIVLTQIGLLPVLTPSGICRCPVPVLPKDEVDFGCEGIPFYDEFHPTTSFNEFSAKFLLEFLEEESARAE
jgi:phospholipase/lecithinase/hemolysin